MQPLNLTWPFDRAQLTQIYRRYLAMIRRRAHSILHDEALAEDAAHEAFARFIAFAEYSEVRDVPAFLYQTTTCVALERLASQTRQVPMVSDSELLDRGVWALEDKLALNKVLALADAESAQIAAMYYLDGMSQEEISQATKIPRRSVAAILQRFCARALRLLRDRDGPPGEEEALATSDEVVQS